MDKLFPKGGEETIVDKMLDPFGKEKEKRERERQKKIKELTGGGTAFTEVPAVDAIAENRPEKLPFGTLLNNMRYHGIANKPYEMINKRFENLKSSVFMVAGSPFQPSSSY